MNKDKFEKATILRKDIEALEVIADEGRKNHWIKVICPKETNWFPSVRFQEELLSWLESKIKEYEKEFESL